MSGINVGTIEVPPLFASPPASPVEGQRYYNTTTRKEYYWDGTAWIVHNVYVQSTAPVNPPATYLWVQTGLGASGNDLTFWVEDGLT